MDTKDHVLDIVLADRAPALAKALMKYGVTDGDPVSEIVRIAVDSDASRAAAAAAANAAGEAAIKVGAAVASIQNEIFQGTQRASADLAAGVARGIENKTAEAGAALMQAIGIAASRGAGELQKAAAGLDKLGAAKGAVFVEQWKSILAATVQKQATTALKKATLREWVAAVFGLGVMLCVGAALAVGYGMTTHKIVDARGIEVRGRGVNTEIIFRRHMVWMNHQDCPPGAACLVTPESSQP